MTIPDAIPLYAGYCAGCVFWQLRDGQYGQCRRMPPAYDPGSSIGIAVTTRSGDWCGEFRDRPTEKAAKLAQEMNSIASPDSPDSATKTT